MGEHSGGSFDEADSELNAFASFLGVALSLDDSSVDQGDQTTTNINPSSLIGVRVPSATQTIDGVSYVVAQDQAQSLFDSIYDDTLGHWASENPTWVNTL